MAPSTPPPPPPPPPQPEAPTATATAAPSTATRPPFQNPPRPSSSNPPHPFYSSPPSRLPSNPNPNYPQLAPRPPPHLQDPSQLLYPVASSGRGFLSRPLVMPAARPSTRPPFVFPYLDPSQGNPGFVRPNHFPNVLLGSGPGSAGNASGAGVMPGVVKGIPVPASLPPKAGPPSASLSDNNGTKDLRNRNKDDVFVTVRDRKVRISDDASLYTLCRSWLKNGFPEETQPPYLDAARPLPRPLPVGSEHQLVDSTDKRDGEKEEDNEDKASVEELSEKELLQRHIKRAKRVRSRLREERLQRITRYKTRLALLLPPMVEQHLKSDPTAPN